MHNVCTIVAVRYVWTPAAIHAARLRPHVFMLLLRNQQQRQSEPPKNEREQRKKRGSNTKTHNVDMLASQSVRWWCDSKRHCANKLDEHSLVGIQRSERHNVRGMCCWCEEELRCVKFSIVRRYENISPNKSGCFCSGHWLNGHSFVFSIGDENSQFALVNWWLHDVPGLNFSAKNSKQIISFNWLKRENHSTDENIVNWIWNQCQSIKTMKCSGGFSTMYQRF